MASEIEGDPDVVVMGLDTDGTDGPTDAAGGMVDGTTAVSAKVRGIDINQLLRRHDSYHALDSMGDLIKTGNTG